MLGTSGIAREGRDAEKLGREVSGSRLEGAGCNEMGGTGDAMVSEAGVGRELSFLRRSFRVE